MSAIVEFRDVCYRVPQKQILRGVSFQVEAGETLALVGRSGSGKTTIVKLVNGLLLPTSGEVRVEGRATSHWDLIRLRRGIGYVIQEVGLFPHLTVARNVGVVPRLEGWDEPKIAGRVAALLEAVGLEPEHFAQRYPRALSGGERQRVGVARALAADPPILLFDEPFGSVDPVTRLELQRQFLALRRTLGKTSIFVTHDIREALLVGTRVGLLVEGRLEVLAPPAEFIRSGNAEARTFLASLEWRREEG